MAQLTGALFDKLIFIALGVFFLYSSRPSLWLAATDAQKRGLKTRRICAWFLILLGIASLILRAFQLAKFTSRK